VELYVFMAWAGSSSRYQVRTVIDVKRIYWWNDCRSSSGDHCRKTKV